MSELVIIVPARLSSSRFPRKLLFEVEGKPIIIWTAERIRSEAPDLPLYFAVEDEELMKVLDDHGFSSVLTGSDHASGTDRIWEANESIGADYVINVQGDEPLVTGKQIRMLVENVRGGADMATLATPFVDPEDYLDPNKVKVVMDRKGRALYFSRSRIPYVRDYQGNVDEEYLKQQVAFWHLGMYAYTAEFLSAFHELPPGQLEQTERLEQLRALENGYSIGVGITDQPTIGIDTPEDVDRFKKEVAHQ